MPKPESDPNSATPFDADPRLQGKTLVLFDGVCNFCDGTVNFIIDHDPREKFVFASLQSNYGQAMASRFGLNSLDLDSVIAVDRDRVYEKSTAAMVIARKLSGLWPVAGFLLRLVPASFRDLVYDQIAKNRYRWFGKKEQCRIPTAQDRKRILA